MAPYLAKLPKVSPSVNLWFRSGTEDLGEVPALDEVSGHVPGGSAVNRRGDVVPGHPGGRVPVDEVCADRAEEGETASAGSVREHRDACGAPSNGFSSWIQSL